MPRPAPPLVLVTGSLLLAVAACETTSEEDWLAVEPGKPSSSGFEVDLGLLPASTNSSAEVEFWNMGEAAWRMELEPTGGAVDHVAFHCDQDYDCNYVAPEGFAAWTVQVEAGTAGSEGSWSGMVDLVADHDGAPIVSARVVLRWTACGDGGPECED